MINARRETIFEKLAFAASIRNRRCLVPASSFFEWQVYDKKQKQPWLFSPKGNGPFAFAGIWDCWASPNGEPLYSVALLTAAAPDSIAHLHHRMPVNLPGECHEQWLSNEPSTEKIGYLLDQANKQFSFHPVSTLVNSLDNRGPETTEEIDMDSPSSAITQKQLF
jgi:putative SOS response-associated peptidase YedK